ncbi:MAG: lytic transglycosylase domain-containing protein [Deltaproteobacteria bacterium]|nr:lytic transglycosylase domain-containing protein [Deltaproteobacteria bacterium]
MNGTRPIRRFRERLTRGACLAFLVTGGLSLLGTVAWADIYQSVSADGSISFTDTPVTTEYRVVIRDPRPVRAASPRSPWQDLARQEASLRQLDPRLVNAVIQVESGENPGALSHKGAMGLMQLMPDTARAMGVQDPFEPRDNIQGGVKYLAQMLDRFHGRLDLALAAYNAGPSAVERYGGVPPYAETRNYVNRVLDAYRRLTNPMALDTPHDGMDNPVSVAGRE